MTSFWHSTTTARSRAIASSKYARSRRHRRVHLLALASALLGCSGCVPYVIPESLTSDSRGNLATFDATTLAVNQTRRVDVLLALGEPDGRADDERWYLYSSHRRWQIGGIGIGGGMGGVGYLAVGAGRQVVDRLTVRFDESGNVTSVERKSQPCRLLALSANFHDESSGPCAPTDGEDLVRAETLARFGPIISSYGRAYWREDACDRLPGIGDDIVPAEVAVGERALLYRTAAPGGRALHEEAWQAIPYASIAELRPVVSRMVSSWVRLRLEEGRCVSFSILRWGDLMPSSVRQTQKRVRAEIAARLPEPAR